MELYSDPTTPTLSHPTAAMLPETVFSPRTATAVPGEPVEQADVNEQVSGPAQVWWDETGVQVVRATRSWIQYGTVAFAVICIVIGAVEALFGR